MIRYFQCNSVEEWVNNFYKSVCLVSRAPRGPACSRGHRRSSPAHRTHPPFGRERRRHTVWAATQQILSSSAATPGNGAAPQRSGGKGEGQGVCGTGQGAASGAHHGENTKLMVHGGRGGLGVVNGGAGRGGAACLPQPCPAQLFPAPAPRGALQGQGSRGVSSSSSGERRDAVQGRGGPPAGPAPPSAVPHGRRRRRQPGLAGVTGCGALLTQSLQVVRPSGVRGGAPACWAAGRCVVRGQLAGTPPLPRTTCVLPSAPGTISSP